MGRPPSTSVEFTIRYEPAGNGWLTALIPSLPGTVSMGRTRAEARANVLDALAQRLAAKPEPRTTRGREERVQAQLGVVRVLDLSHGHGL
jgi:predicted RNase H-like HicB family nuclease